MAIRITLDNSNPAWFTCCGKTHCKVSYYIIFPRFSQLQIQILIQVALIYITIGLIFIEIFEAIAYISIEKSQNVSPGGIVAEVGIKYSY